MLGNYVSCTHVVSSVTLYRSSVVDLSRSRAVHAVEHDPCCPDPVRLQGATCRAVHYGLCSPLLKLPPFVIAPVKPNRTPTPTPPSTPSTPTSATVSLPFAFVSSQPKSNSVSPISNSPPVKSVSTSLNFFDPVQLLADADLEGQLEALVTSFVARDKVRLASRRSHDGKESNSPFNGPSVSESGESVPSETKQERRIIRRPGVEVVGGKLVPVTKSATPEYRRDGGGVKAQINRFAPSVDRKLETGSQITAIPEILSVIKPQLVKENHASTKTYPEENGVTRTPNNSVPLEIGHKSQQQLRNGGHSSPSDNGIPQWERVLPCYPSTDPTSSVLLEEHHQIAAHQNAIKKCGSPERLFASSGSGDAPTIPHPKLTNVQRQHMRERSLSPTDRHHTPVRPFLTKGSVAERVLLFERAPSIERTQAVHPGSIAITSVPTTGYPTNSTKSTLLASAWRGALIDGFQSEKENLEPGFLKTGSLRKLPKTATRATHNIPRFYYPNGKPLDTASTDEHIKKICQIFNSFGNGGIAKLDQFGSIAKACNLPLYCKAALFQAAGGEKKGFLHCDAFLEYWKRVITLSHEESSIFIKLLSKGSRNYIIAEDCLPMIQDIIETHPGLTFLKDAPEFHSRYVHTVIARIFYCVNRSWTGKITAAELRKSNFLRVVHLLEEEEDINQITEYFSYEHFYVIYCKFWELDKDHDLFIDKADLSRHNDGAMSCRMINRIFSGAVTRGPVLKQGKMSYSEFVWFLLSEEDKRHPRSIEYWFRCMDIDGDGFLSMYELEYFYDEQLHRMESLGIETLPYKDCLCQMLDMIRPKVPGCISLSDLKRCKLTPIFFDTFFNLEKYLDHEQRDPFASSRDHEDDLSISDWDRFAAEEYELLVSEENANDQQEDLMYEEYDENELGTRFEKQGNVRQQDNDEDYDYAESDVDYHY